MKWELIQEGMGNYLKVTGAGEETFSDKIFSFQEIPGFLPLEVRWINGEKECIYDIAGRISLAAYLSETIFTERDIRHILLQIISMGARLEEYLLDSNGLVIHEDTLYIEKESGQIAGIYNAGQQSGDIRSFGRLMEYIMEKMNQEDKGLVFFIYEIHKMTKGAGCTKALLRDFIKEGEQRVEWQEKTVSDVKPLAIPEILKAKKEAHFSSWIIPGIFLAAGIFMTVLFWWLGFFKKPLSGQTDWAKLSGAALFFMGVCGYGAWRAMWIADSGKKREKITKYEQEEGGKKVCLIPKTGKEEMIEISTFPFRIGGDERRVNKVLHDKEISPVHTQILREGNNILAADEESEAGTYRNNERLVPWQKTVLHDGDFLRLAGTEYVVEITQSEYVI